MKFVYLVCFVLLILCNNNLCLATEEYNDNNNDDDTSEVMTNEGTNDNVEKEDVGISTSQDIVLRISTGGHRGGGVTYTRFGKTSCPGKASLVYEGYSAGGWYNQKGNGANYLCMPKDPEYLSTSHVSSPSYLYGAEYEGTDKIFNKKTHNYNVPCAVCYRANKSTKLMIPGKTSCPGKWSREYYGYIMTSHHSHLHTVQYECVDSNPDIIPGSQGDTNGALFYFVQVECNRGLPCGPYVHRRPVTCTVCTK